MVAIIRACARRACWRLAHCDSEEMKVTGPNVFERCYALEMKGSFGEHQPYVVRMILGKILPASKNLFNTWLPLVGRPYNLSQQDRPFLRPLEGYWKTIEDDFHCYLEIRPQVIELTGFERASWFFYNPLCLRRSPLDVGRFDDATVAGLSSYRAPPPLE